MRVNLYILLGWALFFVFGCSVIQEATMPISERVINDPVIRDISDTTVVQTIKSSIQTDKEAVLAGSLTFKDGVFLLSISSEMADSLGIHSGLYDSYLDIVNSLNGKQK